MRKVIMTVLLTAGLAGAASAQTPDSLRGDWTGALTPQLPLILRIGDTVSLISVAQGNSPVPATLAQSGGHIVVDVAAYNVKIDATLSADGKQLSGDFQQNASHRPIILTKGAPVPAVGAALPVSVSPPLAQDREVSIDGGRAALYGALTRPAQPRAGPAVLFIAGSGPTDRDSNSTVPGTTPDTFKLMAAALADRGITSLRFDKRGIAKSSPAMAAEANLRFTTYVDDAAAWARYLAAQPGVTCVVILGHSEGALIAPLAAQTSNACGVISISGMGRPFDAVLMEQLQAQNLPAATLDQAKTILQGLKEGKTFPAIPATDALFRPSIQPYLASELIIDPKTAIAAVKAPVLIIQGDNDTQVQVADARLLAAARPDARLVLVPGMNHILKIAPTDRAGNAATYADPKLPLAPGLMEAITAFVAGLAPR